MIDLVEIYTHWCAGRSQVQIAASLGVDRKTVRKYLAPVEAAGLVPGGPPVLTDADWRARAVGWFPQVADAGLRQVTWPAIEVHRDYVHAQLSAGVTVATIHQRLVDEHGPAASVASLRRWVAANLPEQVRRSRVRVLNPTPAAPGGEAQIDYGRLGRWVDPASGRPGTVWAFVMVLSCSRHLFVQPVLRMDQQAWTAAHVAAFEFFGGVPARLVPDNLKTGVDRPDLYDPRLNRCYAELATHYGVLVDPARAATARDKARVDGRCPTCGTRSGVAESSPAWSRCAPRRSGGRGRWPGGGPADRWAAPRRRRCSPRSRRPPWRRCPGRRSCWPAGRPARSARTST